VGCQACGIIRQIKLQFADPKRNHIRGFERYVRDLCGHMTIQDIAAMLGTSWGLIRGIYKRYLRRQFQRPRLKHVRRIAIDEICIGDGKRYLTLVIDLDHSRVVYVGHGREAAALNPFWKRLKASKNPGIEAVAIDMSAAYTRAVTDNLPKATLVYDRFHVVKLFNDKLTKLRRQLYHQLPDDDQRRVLKGSRWLLLKNPDKLEASRDERQRLEQALSLNEPLATAYYLKEDLRQFWEQPSKEAGIAFLLDWIEQAQASGIGLMQRFAKTLISHWKGVNNKIKTLMRQAYGFRDMEFFELRIKALHTARYAFVG